MSLRDSVKNQEPEITAQDPDRSIESALQQSGVGLQQNNEFDDFDNKKAEIEKYLINRDIELRKTFTEKLSLIREHHSTEEKEKRDFSDLLLAYTIEELVIENVQAIIQKEQLIEEFLKKENKKETAYYEEKLEFIKSLQEDFSNPLDKDINRESLLDNAKNLSLLMDELINKREASWKENIRDKTENLISNEKALKIFDAVGLDFGEKEKQSVVAKLPEFKKNIADAMAERPSLVAVQEKMGKLYHQLETPTPKSTESPTPEIPIAPPITSTINTVVQNRYELNTEILFAAKAKALFTELLKENPDSNKNNVPLTHLAAQFTKKLSSELKQLHKDVVEFAEGNWAVKQLGAMKESVQNAFKKLEAIPEQTIANYNEMKNSLSSLRLRR